MFIHIGGDHVVLLRDLIAIVDLRRTPDAECLQIIVPDMAARVPITVIDDGEPKSCVILDHHVYISPISPETLARRAEVTTLVLGAAP